MRGRRAAWRHRRKRLKAGATWQQRSVRQAAIVTCQRHCSSRRVRSAAASGGCKREPTRRRRAAWRHWGKRLLSWLHTWKGSRTAAVLRYPEEAWHLPVCAPRDLAWVLTGGSLLGVRDQSALPGGLHHLLGHDAAKQPRWHGAQRRQVPRHAMGRASLHHGGPRRQGVAWQELLHVEAAVGRIHPPKMLERNDGPTLPRQPA